MPRFEDAAFAVVQHIDRAGQGLLPTILLVLSTIGEGRCYARSTAPAPIIAGSVAQHDAPIYLSGVGTVVRTCNRHFPGTDSEISEQMALDVAEDEKAIIVK
jgi:hypothetical protein